ncbi:MAG: hypothetical protein HDR07_13775 [Lachnospiraceae bacterium]|nr:hypothetical protein [Lachnospiraceae bacterium]
MVSVDGKGAHVSILLRERVNAFVFCEIHMGISRVVAAQEHFAAHGAPYIEGVRGGIIENIVRAVSDIIQSLCMIENALLFFKDQNAVSLRVIRQIDQTVAGKSVSSVDLIGHDLPVCQRICQIIVVEDLVVVAVHDKPGVLYLRDVGGDA